MSSSVRVSALHLWVLMALVIAMMVSTVGVAFAAPTEPTMGTSELQQLIDGNGGSVTGYFKTVLSGSTIVDIPVEIRAVTGGFADEPTALILFESSAPEITAIGGIASGMSGSPLYVDEGVVNDVLVGAVSYGDWFTLDGTGLATPIGAMAAIQGDYGITSFGLKSLKAPVAVGDRFITDIVITSDPSGFEDDADRGTLVARPLATRCLGGLNPNSTVYQAYRKRLEAKGQTLLPMSSGLSGMEHPYDQPFQAGSALAVLAARGDLWAGGIGTATYVDGDTVLAFGHPAYWEGDTGLFMTNAWIDGVWPSTNTPYKLGRPAATRGTITQDRSAGVMGVDGVMSDVATVTATVTNADSSKVGTSTVTIPKHAINSTNWEYDGLAPMSTYIAALRAADAYGMKGSAVTTTTVVVGDGTTEHTIVRTNVFDSSMDIPSQAMWDVAEIVSELQYLGENGIDEPNILSVDLQASITKNRRYAEIVGVNVVGGLRTGSNTAVVSLLEWGVEDTQTVNVPFTIPAGTPLTGELYAAGPYGADVDEDDEGYEDEGDYSAALLFDMKPSTTSRRSVSAAVNEIKAQPANDTLTIIYQPRDVMSELDTTFKMPKVYKPIEAAKRIGWVVEGEASKSAPRFKLLSMYSTFGSSRSVPYGYEDTIAGELLNAVNDGKATVSMRYAGATSSSALGSVSFEADDIFELDTPPLTRKVRFTLSFAGDDDTLPTVGVLDVKVQAKTRLAASRSRFPKGKSTTLTAYVGPLSATGSVVFERYSGGRWRALGTRALVGGKASMKYKPRSTGKYKVRARYVPSGAATNVTSTSATKKLTVY